jgi:hypothetical protein
VTDRLLRAIRLRKACWRLLDRGDDLKLARTVCEAEKAANVLTGEEAALYREFILSDRQAAAILERSRTGAKNQ